MMLSRPTALQNLSLPLLSDNACRLIAINLYARHIGTLHSHANNRYRRESFFPRSTLNGRCGKVWIEQVEGKLPILLIVELIEVTWWPGLESSFRFRGRLFPIFALPLMTERLASPECFFFSKRFKTQDVGFSCARAHSLAMESPIDSILSSQAELQQSWRHLYSYRDGGSEVHLRLLTAKPWKSPSDLKIWGLDICIVYLLIQLILAWDKKKFDFLCGTRRYFFLVECFECVHGIATLSNTSSIS